VIETWRDGQFIYIKSLPETIREYFLALSKIAGTKDLGKNKKPPAFADG
jgi:hypothetical protein